MDKMRERERKMSQKNERGKWRPRYYKRVNSDCGSSWGAVQA